MSDFLKRASQERLLTPEQLRRLTDLSRTTAIDAADLAVQQGVLTPDEVDAVNTLLEGKTALPGYDVQGVLGRGGMGIVYRARQLSLDRLVALKTISARHVFDAVSGARFENEAQLAARLHHPNIVAIYDFGRHAGRLFLAMELLEGDDLESRIEKHGPLAESLGWQIARQAAAGLAHAAELGVIHRDIKPANLLLITPPTGYPLPPDVPLVKIADFGLAFLATTSSDERRVTLAGTTIGSPHYMSPEQLRSPTVDLRSDIYALGATMYHAFTGKPPFDGKTVGDILAKKIEHHLPPISQGAPHVSQAGANLLEQMMAESPSQRFGSYAELLDRIDQVVGNVADQTSPATLRARASQRPTQVEIVTEAAIPLAAPAASSETLPGTRGSRWVLSRRAAIAGSAAAFVSAVGAYFAWRCPVQNLGRAPDIEWSGAEVSLFNGVSLEGWHIQPGSSWSISRDRERAQVLEGRDFARRMLPPDHPVYQISLSCALATAKALDIYFGYRQPGQIPFFVLRYEATRASLLWHGHWHVARIAERSLPPAAADVADYRELRIERRQEGWAIFVHSEPLAFVAPIHLEPANEIMLCSVEGKTWLENIRWVSAHPAG